MRYNTPVYFQAVKSGELNPTTHNYEADTITEAKRYAAVTDAGTETINLIYGAIKQGVLTVRLQQPYKEPFDNIRIGEKRYKVDFSRHLKVFVISEVQ
jgi:hypothetical protein